MAILVTRIKQEYGVSYSPKAKADLDAGIDVPFADASEVFINGMLGEDRNRRWGTCSSIPVLVTAVARKLGYPVRLALAKHHVYCRWEDGERGFNIEASNPAGMAVLPDTYYHAMRGGVAVEHKACGFQFRSLTPAEEFATFMIDRVICLADAGRHEEAFVWSARALQFSPDNPTFARDAYAVADVALKRRYRLKHGGSPIGEAVFPVGDLLAVQERSPMMTIAGHYRESIGDLDAAKWAYQEACRHNPRGRNEPRDLERFLKKHGTKERTKEISCLTVQQ